MLPGCRILGRLPSPCPRRRPVAVALLTALALAAVGCGPSDELAAVGRTETPTALFPVDTTAPPPVAATSADEGPPTTEPVPEAPPATDDPVPTAAAAAPAPVTATSTVPPAPVPPVGPVVTPPDPLPAPAPLPPCGWRSGAPPVYQHVVWIWMENRRFSDVIGNPNAPYETQLAAGCGTATNFAHAGQPSLPNYIAATSGDTQGIVDNGHPTSHPLTVDNIFRQVRTAGGTARTYAESMPVPCWAGESGHYTYITNPALYYSSLGDAAACLADDVPMGTVTGGALASDIAAGTLPTFATIVPDLCGNSHDCPVAAGDAWLARWVPRILAGADYRTEATAVFVVWDEFTPMPFIAVAPSARPGTVVGSPLDHYGLLRTTEEMLGLPFLGRAATAVSMRSLFGL